MSIEEMKILGEIEKGIECLLSDDFAEAAYYFASAMTECEALKAIHKNRYDFLHNRAITLYVTAQKNKYEQEALKKPSIDE